MNINRATAEVLVYLRDRAALTQKDLARHSGVGEKTISSFETGERIHALKLSQLRQLLAVCSCSLAEFEQLVAHARYRPAPLSRAEQTVLDREAFGKPPTTATVRGDPE